MSDALAPANNRRVFRRLLKMLRPFWGWIVLGAGLLLIAAPCELFPALAWGFITDDIVLRIPRTPWLHKWFSFNGRITDRFHLLLSATSWMFVLYLIGEFFETLEQWILNRAAQRFILGFRNRVYHKLQSQSLGYLQ